MPKNGSVSSPHSIIRQSIILHLFDCEEDFHQFGFDDARGDGFIRSDQVSQDVKRSKLNFGVRRGAQLFENLHERLSLKTKEKNVGRGFSLVEQNER